MKWMAITVAMLVPQLLFADGNSPSVPTGLTGTVDGGRVVLHWNASTDDEGVEGYNVYRDNQYIDTVLQTRYEGAIDDSRVNQFHVVAFDAEPRNFSAASESISLPADLIPDDLTIPPSVPSALVGDINGETVNLSWAASTDDESVQGYNIYQNNSYVSTVFEPSYTGTVSPGQQYAYYIVAFDIRTNFSDRSETLFLPDIGNVDTSVPPSTPSGLSGSVTENGSTLSVEFNWDPSTDDRGVSGYNVYVNDGYRDTVFTTSYVDAVAIGEANDYSVVAFDIDGNFSARSDGLTLPEPSGEVDTQSPPTSPTNLSGTVESLGDEDRVTLNWSASTDNIRVVGYNIYRNDSYETTVFTTSHSMLVNAGSVNTFFIVAFDQHSNFSNASEAPRLTLPNSDGNQAPYFVNLEDQIVTVGLNWDMVIEPKDSDGDVPGLFIGALPEGMQSIDNLDGTRTLSWQPLQPAVGIYSITFTAFDAKDSSIRTVRTITLDVQLPDDLSIIPNRPPTIDALPAYVIRYGDTVVMRVKAVDANGTVPNLSMNNLPDDASFEVYPLDPRIRVLRWQTDESDQGIQVLNFRATDAEDDNLVAEGSTTIEVKTPADFIRDGERLKDLATQNGIQFGYASLLEITEQADGDLYAAIAADEFNLVTPENSMKWGYINPEPGEYRFEDADNLVSFAASNDMQLHGHALVWYTQIPQWVQDSNVSDREALMNEFIDTMLDRYPDVALWDVVNEALEDDGSFRNSVWFEAMGAEHVDKAFRRAREADANAELIYNDYDIGMAGPKADAMIDLVAGLVQNGVPIDGVGFQMHLNSDFDAFDEVSTNFQRVADLGLDVYITELDVVLQPGDTAADQAAVYEGAVDACLSQNRCKAVQIWGFTDRYTWRRPNPALILDEQYQPKPAYTALQSVLK
ncbi:MAG: endo-1,4-beta-xylanase [Gammaproteobacteria bacterium]|nr:endo-1,4-beta-xylanase [Gammaproteobacteria bacterium]